MLLKEQKKEQEKEKKVEEENNEDSTKIYTCGEHSITQLLNHCIAH